MSTQATRPNGNAVRLAAVGDLHFTRHSTGKFKYLFSVVQEQADVLLLCGDIVDYGLREEAELFCKELSSTVKLPVIAVLGNHEHESGQQEILREIFSDAGIRMLDGESCVVHGIGFAGIKGFGGGFGRYALQAWGEGIVKEFTRESVNEALKLESALAKLRTRSRVALMHYSPIEATVANEPREIFPFLGSSHLEEPLNRYAVGAVFHGHAHRGLPEGQTYGGVPVYNVAMPLLQSCYPNRPPVRFLMLEPN